MSSINQGYPWEDISKGFVWCPEPHRRLSLQLVLLAMVDWAMSEGYTQGECDMAEAREAIVPFDSGLFWIQIITVFPACPVLLQG